MIVFLMYLESGTSIRPVRVNITVCSSFLSRLKGALGKGRIEFREGFLFPGARQIHTAFMRSSISVLSFDEEGSILNYRAKLPPFRYFRASVSTHGLIELAPGRFRETEIDVTNCNVKFSSSVATEAGLPELAHTARADA